MVCHTAGADAGVGVGSTIAAKLTWPVDYRFWLGNAGEVMIQEAIANF